MNTVTITFTKEEFNALNDSLFEAYRINRDRLREFSDIIQGYINVPGYSNDKYSQRHAELSLEFLSRKSREIHLLENKFRHAIIDKA